MTSDMGCIVQEFLVESYENLDQLDQALVALEDDAYPQERLARIFRAIHTIKGTCGFLGFSHLERLSHAGESLLSRMRDGEVSPTPTITNALLQLLDSIREILSKIESTGQEGDSQYQNLLELLIQLQDAKSEQIRVAAAECTHDAPDASAGDASAGAGDPRTAPQPDPRTSPRSEDPHTPQALCAGLLTPHSSELGPREHTLPQPPSDVNSETPPTKQTERTSPASPVADAAIRVDVRLLDKLMVLVGELVLARNRIQQHASSLSNPTLLGSSQRLNLITTELQEAIMKTRLQPIGSIWSKFPRIIRDLAIACNKQVHLEMAGLETELDKTLIEAIKDPFTHLVRNSIDHGIETPSVRTAQGKPAHGRISLRAYHEGGQVNVEITDDGAGISVDRIKNKAVERGLLTQEHASAMNDREAIRLIFLPGFSTAEKVTNVSGRGVGMDVVKANIERIGGTIEIFSQVGIGTTILIKIPLTLAIIPALMIGSGTDRFALPQVNVLELVRLEGDQARQGIESVHGAPVYRLRGKLLPLIDLNRELGFAPPTGLSRRSDDFPAAPPQHAPRLRWASPVGATIGQLDMGSSGFHQEPEPLSANDSAINIVVLQAENCRFGLVVDSILDSAEIVVKPLDKRLHGIRAFAGATILGDGKLALILDIVNIAKSVGLISDSGGNGMARATGVASNARAPLASQPDAVTRADSTVSLLVFEADNGGRLAIPLSAVTRLEEIPASQIERVGSDWVVQYRGQILPLIDTAQTLYGQPSRNFALLAAQSSRPVSVVVCLGGDRPCGLVVDQILDIVEQNIETRGKSTRPGIEYTSVVNGRVTEIVDVVAITVAVTLRVTKLASQSTPPLPQTPDNPKAPQQNNSELLHPAHAGHET